MLLLRLMRLCGTSSSGGYTIMLPPLEGLSWSSSHPAETGLFLRLPPERADLRVIVIPVARSAPTSLITCRSHLPFTQSHTQLRA